jgi:hypothetical protein
MHRDEAVRKAGTVGQSAANASHAASRRAEQLLRALVGVQEAEVSLQADGGALVRIAAEGQPAGLLMRNIRSALLAGLGVTVRSSQIELIDPAQWIRTDDIVLPGDVAAILNAPELKSSAFPETPVDDRGAAVNAEASVPAAPPAPHVPRVERARAPRPDPLLAKAEARRSSTSVERPVRAMLAERQAADVCVERIELVRHAGRIRCRVVIAAGEERFSAVAEATDGAGAEIQLAGRITCDALRAGGLTGAQFESATIAWLAGRVHVVAALGDWRQGEPRPRSGSAVASESLEHAAARAVLQAVLAQPTD